MSVFVASLAALSPSGSIAAQHGHAGGLTPYEWLGLAVIAVIVVVVFTVNRSRPASYQEPSRYEVLMHRLEGLDASGCRWLCSWLAQGSRVHQQALEDALDAREESVQGNDGEE